MREKQLTALKKPSAAPKRTAEKISRSKIIPIIGVIAAATLLTFRAVNKDHAPKTTPSASIVPQKIPQLDQTPENLAHYTPPSEAGFIQRKNFFPGVQKTVIFLPEVHKPSTGVSGMNPNEGKIANIIHTEIYQIVVDLMRKFGGMPIALEAWLKEKDRLDIGTDHELQPLPILRQLMQIKDLDQRIEAGRKLVATTEFPAYIILLSVFGKDLPPIGTSTKDEMAQTELLKKKLQASINLDTSQKPVCQGAVSKNNFNTAEMVGEFTNGNQKDVAHCYCAVHSIEENDQKLVDARKEYAPLRELQAALQTMEDVVILSSGQGHNKKATDELDKTKAANYIVVTSVSLDEYIKLMGWKDESRTVFYPDTPSHVCADLMKSNPDLVLATIRSMLEIVSSK